MQKGAVKGVDCGLSGETYQLSASNYKILSALLLFMYFLFSQFQIWK